ncbi:hypothetical protein [Listeria grandensis]|nr:hypothetical protein [Listeria grandensis]
MKKLIITGAILGTLLLGLSSYFVYQLHGVAASANVVQLELVKSTTQK